MADVDCLDNTLLKDVLFRGFPTRMVYLKHDIYSRDTPFWSGTLNLNRHALL